MDDETKNQNSELKLVTREFIESLTKREAKVLKEISGISVEGTSSLEQVAKKFEVTRERIRQIEEKALRKLRNKPDNNDPSAA